MVVRFRCRVTTALRAGSDAADIFGCPPFWVIVQTDDDRHYLIDVIIAHRRKFGFVAEHIVQTAFQRVGDAMRDFKRGQSLRTLNGVQRLPAHLGLSCKLSLR